ncbi:MAG: hypothetical protein HY903_04190 [Deltaproteobacteria bacterium]|nr:hypothetical protein [Deltaproteobacteria bacterium]
MTRLALPTLLVALLLPATALAAWTKLSGGTGQTALIAVSAPTATDVFATGFTLDTSTMVPHPVPHIYASSTGGRSFSEITGSLSGPAFWVPTLVQFFDGQFGFVAGGKALFVTTNRGGAWTTRTIPFNVKDMFFFDGQRGVLVGEGGAMATTFDAGGTFNPIVSGTGVDLHRTFWLDADHGWISAYTEVDGTDQDGNPTVSYEDGVVLRTTNGGQSFSTSTAFAGLGLGALFFLPGGLHGFVVAFSWIDADRSEPSLWKTSDGGATFSNIGLPLQVGTLDMIVSQPINTNHLVAMSWADSDHGHLAGSAYVTKVDDLSGNPKRYWRVVDYVTANGGSTWTKTDLGTITISMGSGPPNIQNDMQMTAGTLRSFYDGLMVGEAQAVWGYDHSCASPADCPPSYSCTTNECVPPAYLCNPPCSFQDTCVGGTCVPKGGDADHGVGGDGDTYRGSGQTDDGGCSCKGVAPSPIALVLCGAVARALWRRRRLAPCR